MLIDRNSPFSFSDPANPPQMQGIAGFDPQAKARAAAVLQALAAQQQNAESKPQMSLPEMMALIAQTQTEAPTPDAGIGGLQQLIKGNSPIEQQMRANVGMEAYNRRATPGMQMGPPEPQPLNQQQINQDWEQGFANADAKLQAKNAADIAALVAGAANKQRLDPAAKWASPAGGLPIRGPIGGIRAPRGSTSYQQGPLSETRLNRAQLKAGARQERLFGPGTGAADIGAVESRMNAENLKRMLAAANAGGAAAGGAMQGGEGGLPLAQMIQMNAMGLGAAIPQVLEGGMAIARDKLRETGLDKRFGLSEEGATKRAELQEGGLERRQSASEKAAQVLQGIVQSGAEKIQGLRSTAETSQATMKQIWDAMMQANAQRAAAGLSEKQMASQEKVAQISGPEQEEARIGAAMKATDRQREQGQQDQVLQAVAKDVIEDTGVNRYWRNPRERGAGRYGKYITKRPQPFVRFGGDTYTHDDARAIFEKRAKEKYPNLTPLELDAIYMMAGGKLQ